ncbi:MAG: nitrogen regulation protein NR(II) [Proteobacteria bacterium]|nr:nitrogen regulation protein NR(II) [Pseudomonadota bacterium]
MNREKESLKGQPTDTLDASREPSVLILSNLNTAILSLDHELRVRFINQSAENLLQVSSNRSKRALLKDIIPGFADLVPVLFESLQTGQPYTQRQSEITLASGQVMTADLTITPINEGEWPFLLIELHGLDRYLRIDRDAALDDHQEVSHQMMRGLAHEVKNPLGGIRGSAQLLERQLDSEELREYTRIIIEETDRLTSLVDRMLGPTQLPDPKPTNVHELLERIRRLILMEDHNVTIRQDYDPSIPELSVDPELLHQALLNVARNGLQSMDKTPDPTLVFRTRVERQLTVGNQRHRHVLRIDIADNGSGIPDEIKDHLFYPMISGRAGGTGLGLPLVFAVIKQHRGSIEFDSKPGDTTFHIFIPLEEPS